MKTVVCQLALGRTRVSGYTLYDHDRMAFEETTPRDTKYLIKQGMVNGLKLDKDGEIKVDEQGYNCKNLLVKSGVGNYRPLFNDDSLTKNGMFALTKVACTDDGLVYEVVSNECARLPITEQKLRALYQVGCLCGCWINDDTGMIEFAKGVEMVDMTSEAIKLRQMVEQRAAEEKAKQQAEVESDGQVEEHLEVTEEVSEEVVENTAGATEEHEVTEPEQAEPQEVLGFDDLPTLTEDSPTELAEGEQSLEEMLGITEEEPNVEEEESNKKKKSTKGGSRKGSKKSK